MSPPLRRLVITTFVLAALVRLAAIPMGLDRSRSMTGSFFDEYSGIAENIVEGNGFAYAWFGELRPTSIHAPVYPYLLSGVFSVSSDDDTRVLIVLLLNTLFSLGLLALAFLFARHFLGDWPAWVALLVLAFYPTQIFYAVSGIPTALYALMFLWALWAAVSVQRQPGWRTGAHLGLAIGVCALSYSFILVIAPFLVLWILANLGATDRREGFMACVLAAVLAAGICTPWTIRNHRVHDHWILIRDQGGTNLWWGNGPYATGGPIDVLGNRLGSFPPEISAQLQSFANEVEGDRFLGEAARRHMVENPVRTLRLWLHKVRLFVWFDDPNQLATGSAVQRLFPVLAALKALLLLAAAWGLFLQRRNLPFVTLVLLACFAVGGVHTAFHAGRIRYFFPLEPLLAMPAAATAWWLFERLRRPAASP